MLLISSWRIFIRLLYFALFPSKDSRRGAALHKAGGYSPEAGGAVLSLQKLSVSIARQTKGEKEFIIAAFGDCTGHIKHYKTEHWVVASWLMVAQIALTYGILTTNLYLVGLRSASNILFLLPTLIGCFGLVLMNELSVALERNRHHLDSLRLAMGGYISSIYVDFDSSDFKVVSRQVQKRDLEMITHLSFLLLSSFCVFAILLKHNIK